MKKILVSILTVVILYNAILPNLFYKVRAYVTDNLVMENQPDYGKIMNNATVEDTLRTRYSKQQH